MNNNNPYKPSSTELIMDQISALVDEVKKRNARRILMQIPEGLKLRSTGIIDALAAAGVETVLSAERCFGACDIKDDEAAAMGCDLVVHVGHNKFYVDFPTKVPVLYFPWYIDIALENVDFSVIREKRIGLISTIQHLNALGKIKEMLEAEGKEAHIGGQILGCWVENVDKLAGKVDAFLYVGSGVFHPTAVRGHKVYRLDAETGRMDVIDITKIEQRRYANIYHARNAKTFGILVTTKKGQRELLGAAENIKRRLEEKDKKASILIMDEITDDKLAGLKFDAYINTACPRIAEDVFSRPLVNAADVEEVLDDES